jgi:hypothetical protein
VGKFKYKNLNKQSMKKIEVLKERFEKLNQDLEDKNDEAEQGVIDLELEINDALENPFEKNINELKALKKKIISLKKEHNFYDEETELDRMFPERHEEGFDEDSMSFDSVFGDE